MDAGAEVEVGVTAGGLVELTLGRVAVTVRAAAGDGPRVAVAVKQGRVAVTVRAVAGDGQVVAAAVGLRAAAEAWAGVTIPVEVGDAPEAVGVTGED